MTYWDLIYNKRKWACAAFPATIHSPRRWKDNEMKSCFSTFDFIPNSDVSITPPKRCSRPARRDLQVRYAQVPELHADIVGFHVCRWRVVIRRLYCELARDESEKAAVDCQGPDCVVPHGNCLHFPLPMYKMNLSDLNGWFTWRRDSPRRDGWGRRGGGGPGVDVAALGEQLPDFSVQKSKEVHVGISTMQVLILHQELTEQHLWLVLLPHNVELTG